MATYKSIKYLVPVEAVEHTDSINALNDVDTNTVAPTDGQTIKWNGTNWVPSDIEEAAASGTQKALFGFGYGGFGSISGSDRTNVTNLVSSSGVVATDTTGVGTARSSLAAAGYGGDKAIFGFGWTEPGDANNVSMTNLVSNTGVVSTDTTGVGTARNTPAAAGYGGDKAIFGFGESGDRTNITNLVSNAGVVASDTTGVGTERRNLSAAGYGGDKAIFGFGNSSSANTNITNLVSSSGVVASDTTNVSGVTGREHTTAASYGGDKAIFGFGASSGNNVINVTNLVSNAGVVATDTTGVGQARDRLSAAGYGGDKAIFGFGTAEIEYERFTYNLTNLVSNTGVVASNTTGVGTARYQLAAAGYSTTA